MYRGVYLVMSLPKLKKIFEIADQIPGGEASGMCPRQFDQEALMKGIHVEAEHTNDIMTAMEIAMDHLAEDPEYYEKLELVHKEEE
jgi:hypothetical protein